jgi:hypothetical protein
VWLLIAWLWVGYSMDYVPSESALNLNNISVDADTKAMLEKLGLNIAVSVKDVHRRQPGGDRDRRAAH